LLVLGRQFRREHLHLKEPLRDDDRGFAANAFAALRREPHHDVIARRDRGSVRLDFSTTPEQQNCRRRLNTDPLTPVES